MTAVIIAIPGVPGLHCVALGFQLPAQAAPLLAIESGAAEFGLPLETRNSMVPPTTVVPLAFLPVALKFCVPPTSREMLLAGLNETLCTALFPGLALFLPRQPVSMATNAIMIVIRKPELQRCMNPPRVRSAKREHIL